MKPSFSTVIICLLACQLTYGQTSLQRVASSLASPLYGTHVPGDTNRMFWLEQGSGGTGRIRVQNLTSGSVSTFMSISGLLTTGERGLLGLAFDPDYANNGYFYTYVSASSLGHRSEIRRYSVNPADPNLGDPSSASTLMSFSQPFSNHNGGWIGFNPQLNPGDPQYLYIASGDGGSGGDPGNRAQDITNQPLGKMLRIDVSGDDFPADPTRNYAIPPNNPFVGQAGDDEIWAYGLRNPWRSSFDRETGDLWIGDVGQNQREEIDFQPYDSPGGENYGWRVMEANRCFDPSQANGNVPCFDPSLTAPIHEYTHALGNSVTGGYVYRGSISQYEGLYFFGDYGSNQIWSLDPHAVNPTSTVRNRNAELMPNLGSISGISSFAEDASGEMYLVSYFGGSTYRFESTSARAEWTGNDASSGAPGDGTSWSQAANWTRGGNVDVAFQAKDEVVFVPGSSITTLALGGQRTVGGVRFQDNFTLTGDTLTVLSGNVRVSAGVTARIDSNLSAETSSASLRKRDGGTLLVGGTAGQMVVLEGTLGGTGTVSNLIAKEGTKVAPGTSVGQLNVGADFTQESGSTLEIELLDTLNHDVLAVGDEASLQGNLALVTEPGYAEPGVRGTVDQFVFLNAGDVQGQFDEVTFDGSVLDLDASLKSHAGEGLFRGLVYSDTEVLFFNYYALAGDATGDGIVDGADFLVWNDNKFLNGTDWLSGDFNGDGITDGSDFLLWNENKFTQIGLPAVPEPSACLLLLSGVIVLLIRRPRSGQGMPAGWLGYK